MANMLNITKNWTVTNPYRSGLPIEKLPKRQPLYNPEDINTMRRIVDSQLWLLQSTRPDIATITNMLLSYQTIPTPAHIQAAKRVVSYLLSTNTLVSCLHRIKISKWPHSNTSLSHQTNYLGWQTATGACKTSQNHRYCKYLQNYHSSKHDPFCDMLFFTWVDLNICNRWGSKAHHSPSTHLTRPQLQRNWSHCHPKWQ